MLSQQFYAYSSSLSPRKTQELNWNIYVLQKKDTLAMFQQFVSNNVVSVKSRQAVTAPSPLPPEG